MKESFYIVPELDHNRLVSEAFASRGYDPVETETMTRLCAEAARHGIRSHNALKAIHLDDLFGSKSGGCIPGAQIERLPSRFPATQVWDAHFKLGPAVAYEAVEACVKSAQQFGIGTVAVDNAWHYLWGGGYVLEMADQGYIGYTQCTAMLPEVVPYGGKRPALGTNPHSWAFPTRRAIGFNVLIDWATSAIAMGRVQQFEREGESLPPESAVDAEGRMTRDPAQVAGLLPFGAHKGYGLGLMNELVAAFTGGSLPSTRGSAWQDGDKHGTCFFFMAVHPDAFSSTRLPRGRSRDENIRAVLNDILSSGNEEAILPGQREASMAAHSSEAGGLLFTESEITLFDRIASGLGLPEWSFHKLEKFSF